jgi:hypothetical protein
MTTSSPLRASTRSLLLGCALLVAPHAAAQSVQEQPPAQQPAPAQEDPRARDLNRVLHLAGGGTLRARTRWVDDHWEYRRDGEWTALASAAVERAVDERELLAEAKKLERGVARDDWARRVALADWMMSAGLLDESFDQLDRVLAADPDQPEALKLLRGVPDTIRAPGDGLAATDAVRQAAAAPPAIAEVAIARFGAREDSEAIEKALHDALGSYSSRTRALAARALRRLRPGTEVRELLSRAVLDGAESVRQEAALALRDVGDESVLLPVLRALGSSSPAVRNNAVDAMASMSYPAAVMPLVSRLATLSSPQSGGGWKAPHAHIFVGRQSAYIQDYDVEVAQFAAVADPQVNTLIEGSVLDVRVIGVYETSTAIESRHIRSALRRLTGADPGNSNRAWADWWEQNKSKYAASAPPSGPITRSN